MVQVKQEVLQSIIKSGWKVKIQTWGDDLFIFLLIKEKIVFSNIKLSDHPYLSKALSR